MKLPSVAQMVNRSNHGHRRVLRAISEGQPVATIHDGAGSVRGLLVCIRTLRRWQCIDEVSLTDRGRELLDALDARTVKA